MFTKELQLQFFIFIFYLVRALCLDFLVGNSQIPEREEGGRVWRKKK